VSGTFTVGDPDGLDDIQTITLAGTEFDVSNGLEGLVGESVETGYGVVTITSYADGVFGYEYELTTTVDNDSQAGATTDGFVESFLVSVSDGEYTSTVAIDIAIMDDEPVAGMDPSPAAVTLEEEDIGTTLALGQILLDASGTASQSGADSPAETVYGLEITQDGVDSGLRTTDGQSVFLYRQADGSVMGRTAGGTNAFSVQMNSETGVLSITMLAALNHPINTEVLEIDSDLLFATVSITDADGDTDVARVDVSTLVGFGDSEPTITSVENTIVDNLSGMSVSGTITASAPDMIAGFDLSSSLGLAPEGLTYSIDASGTLVATDAFGDTVFTLSIDESGQYNFTLLKPNAGVEASSPNFSGLVLEAGNPTTSAVTQLYASYDPVTGAGVGDPVTTVVFSAGTRLLNPSNDGLGVDNNLIEDPVKDVSDALTMSFADDLSNATLHVGNLNDRDVLVWKAYNNGVLVDSGEIHDTFIGENGSVVSIANSESPTYWIDLSLNGLDDGVRFDTLELSAANDTSYKFLAFTVEKPLIVEDVTFDFGANAVDGDGDVSETVNFSVTVDADDGAVPEASPSSMFPGEEGADVLQYTLAEPEDATPSRHADVHNPQSHDDVLDLADILPPESSDNLTSYLHFEESGKNSTLVKISTEGAFTGDPEHDAGVEYQSIELHNVDLLSLGSDQEIIDTLISHGKLIVD